MLRIKRFSFSWALSPLVGGSNFLLDLKSMTYMQFRRGTSA
jgi:hypothetical protein